MDRVVLGRPCYSFYVRFMIIIADSGSTKTAWRLLAGPGQIEQGQTIGLNPHRVSADDFTTALQETGIGAWNHLPITKVYFYSAGITNIRMQEKVMAWLQPWFAKAAIITASDLLGAARAAYHHGQGIIGILGTGSNSGYYNGHEISPRIPALGYLLGDEGSGNALGKRLATAYLRHSLPESLTAEFEAFYPEHDHLLNNLYATAQPGRLLASLVPFLRQNLQHQYIAALVREEFNRYFRLLQTYAQRPVALAGSVAYYFQEIIREVAPLHQVDVVKIIKSPIDDLVVFHQQEL